MGGVLGLFSAVGAGGVVDEVPAVPRGLEPVGPVEAEPLQGDEVGPGAVVPGGRLATGGEAMGAGGRGPFEVPSSSSFSASSIKYRRHNKWDRISKQ